MRHRRIRQIMQVLLLILLTNGFFLIEYQLVPRLGDRAAAISGFAFSMLLPPLRVEQPAFSQAAVQMGPYGIQPLSVIGLKSLLYAVQGIPPVFSDPEHSFQVQAAGDPPGETVADGVYQAPIASSIFMDEEGGNEEIGSDEDTGQSGPFAVNNDSGLSLDITTLAASPLGFKQGSTGPKVLILHTHTTEAYVGGLSGNTSKNSTDNQRNVVRVGEEIARYLDQVHGISTIHVKTIHDLPDYNYSYTNAMKTIQASLKQYPSIQVILDIHRDGVSDGQPFRTSLQSGEGSLARVMVVAGSPASGLPHPLWKENVKFGLIFCNALSQRVPGLVRSLYISEYRYNQHASTGALILEVGGDGNSIGEAIASTPYIAAALADVLK
ncbi:MAG TPA: hypothetical protein DD727_09370 [Clostridiales bacterium]|nr:hypothetical protein [Clostridiales bacterium]